MKFLFWYGIMIFVVGSVIICIKIECIWIDVVWIICIVYFFWMFILVEESVYVINNNGICWSDGSMFKLL